MKKIKINYVGFWPGFDYKEHLFHRILSQRYEIELSNNPEFVICSIYGSGYEYMKYDCPRILYLYEIFTPDFNVFDYAISHDRLVFEDRHFRYPLCISNYLPWHRPAIYAQKVAERTLDPNDTSILKSKDTFCVFMYSHESENRIREIFFEKLSKKYKQVSSAGTFLNNMPDGKNVPISEKLIFQERCKFTIAFEPVRQSGFCTEKILDAFYSKTIPIYYGDPRVTEIFNPEAFINVSDYKNYDEVIEVIRMLDNNDEAYMKMLAAPAFNDPGLPKKRDQELCEFIYSIFDQEPSHAFRRSRFFASKMYNDELKRLDVIKSGKWGARLYNAAFVYETDGICGICRRIKERILIR